MTISSVVTVWWVFCALVAPLLPCTIATAEHKSNWAVIVDTSRYWYNYRHVANALTFYHTVKRLGIPDNQIILMLAEDVACNPRTPEPGRVYNDRDHAVNLYGGGSDQIGVEVDFRGDDVSVDSFLRLLTGRQPAHTPLSRRLATNEESNIFVFMTGHGGNEFLKFQDWEEVSSWDLANAFSQMYEQKRYKNVFFLSDTCQAATLHKRFYSPNILAAGCSKLGQNSFSHHMDRDLGVAVIDRFTYYSLRILEKYHSLSPNTVENFFATLPIGDLSSTPELRTDLFGKKVEQTKITHFLASSASARLHQERWEVRPAPKVTAASRSERLCSLYANSYTAGPRSDCSQGRWPDLKERFTIPEDTKADIFWDVVRAFGLLLVFVLLAPALAASLPQKAAVSRVRP